jgi:hypothetical protein
MSDLSNRFDRFLPDFFRLWPLHATAAGAHEHDGAWPDLTGTGRLERLGFLDRWEAELRGMRVVDPTSDDAIDRDLLLSEIEALRFEETDLREDRWDPLSWVYLLGAGIFPLLVREHAPLAVRLGSVASRLAGIPAVVDAAVAALTGLPGRPVSRLHAETALAQLPGVVDLVDDALSRATDAAPTDPAVAAVVPALQAAADAARAALERFRVHDETVLLPVASGDGRLGADLHARKLAHALRTNMTRDALRARAAGEFEAVRAEMLRVAIDLWPAWIPGRPLPTVTSAGSAEAAERETVATVLDAIALEHPAADGLVSAARTELGGIEAFVRERDLIGLVEEPLAIDWTPAFLRAFAGAMLDSPGPLDRGLRSFYYLTPPSPEWTPEQVESYLREQNDRMLRAITIHEAVPGHYLQLAYANRCPSLVRAIFSSGVFVEGWAVYVTQVMIDAGYRPDDLALRLVHWKYYLRAVANTLLDIGVHADGMTEEAAMRLMVDLSFQEESEARRKWDRARLTSAQLPTYFVGSMELWDLERDVRRRLAAASGDPRGADAVPEPRVVGGFGETPGFRYRDHLEAVIGHGSPTPRLLRRILLVESGDGPGLHADADPAR